MPGKWLLLIVAAVLLGLGAGAISLLIRGPDHGAALTVVEAPASARPVVRELSLTGTVVAKDFIGVPAPVEGTLDALLVSVGEEVFEGQLLAQIRNSTVEVELRVAEEEVKQAEAEVSSLESAFIAARLEASRASAELSRARGEFRRAEKARTRSLVLIREGATPRMVHERVEEDYRARQSEFDSLQQVAEAADARAGDALRKLDKARLDLEDFKDEMELLTTELLDADVVSPANGLLTGMAAQQGDEVHPVTGDLFQIAVDLSRLEVVVEADQSLIGQVAIGQAARIYLAELPGESVEGMVSDVKPGRAVIEFLSPTTAILPGLSAQVTIQVT